MRKEIIVIPPIELKWSPWYFWDKLRIDVRKGGIEIPTKAGVYEVKIRYSKYRLTIGRGKNVKDRLKRRLLRGRKHSASERIIHNEDTSKIVIRWALTNRPAAVEEELHIRHFEKFGSLPKYAKRT